MSRLNFKEYVMKCEQEILKNFITSLSSSLSDEDIQNLKIHSPKFIRSICILINDYI